MTEIRGISSMATRLLLAELAGEYARGHGVRVAIESVGGVDAARRVEAGEPFDLVVLASDAIEKLAAGGHVLEGSKTGIVRSEVAVAIQGGAPAPDVSTEESLRAAVLAAPTIGYSTGPSGTALLKLFERWGVAPQVKERLVQAPAGVPVGSLVARGDVALGFQQLSELIHQEGIRILGTLPEPVRITTIFSGAVCAASTQPDAVSRLLAFMASPATADAKRRQGMEGT
jgi:molybdate transport system substrate-binding protein